MMPLVSIIIPTKNRRALLLETLESVRAESSDAWEAIIVDDASTDGTGEAIDPLCKSDPRIRYIKLDAKRQGAPAARNVGFASSQSPFVIYLDSDDLLAPHCISQRVEAMQQNPDLDFLIYPCELFRKSTGDVQLLWNADTGEDDLDRLLKMDVPWQTTSPIWRRQALIKLGNWDEEVLAGQDWELHIRAVCLGLKYERMPNRDCYWRMAEAERDSIGKSSFGVEMTRARHRNIPKMLDVVVKANLLTQARKEMFAGMYFQAAERVATRVSRKEGRAIWAVALQKSLITTRQYKQGNRYLLMLRWLKIAAKMRANLELAWPAHYFIKRTSTYLKTPLPPSPGTPGQGRGEGPRAPTISVVLAAYNAEKYLAEAVESILNQTFRDFEFIIIDDGSTDDTKSMLETYAKSDPRIRLISRPNKGLTPSLNEGLSVAKGEFIARMDSDDVSLPARFEKQVAYFRAHPQTVLLGTRTELIDPYGLHIGNTDQPVDHDAVDKELIEGKGGAVCHPAAMYLRDLAIELGGYRAHAGHNEDLDLWLRLAERGRIANLPEVLFKYRRHLESIVHTRYEQQWKVKRRVIEEAYVRREMAMPENWSFVPWKPKPIPFQLQEWAWAAIKQGKVVAARGHAKALVKHAPLSIHSWRTLYCAWRGR